MKRYTESFVLVTLTLFIQGCLLSPKPAEFQGPRPVQVLFSGDVRGEVEPCGCASGQKGGIPRRSSFIKEQKSKNPSTLVFDTGNAFSASSHLDPFMLPLVERKARFMVEAMNRMGYTAYLPGVLDLALGEKRLAEWLQEARFAVLNPGLSWHFPKEEPEILGDLFGIGMVVGVKGFLLEDNPDKEDLHAFDRRFAETLRKFQKKGAGLAVVLYSGPYRYLDRPSLQNAPINTLILTSYEGAWWPKPKTLGPNGRVLAVSIPKEGQYMGQFDLVLVDPKEPLIPRIEWMSAFYKKRLLEEALKRPELANRPLVEKRYRLAEDQEQALAKKNLFSWQVVALDDRIPEDPEMKATAKNLKLQIQQEYKKRLGQNFPASQLKQGVWSVPSDQDCKPCHAKAWSQWAATSHARALGSLVREKADNNPECISCHSSGFNPDLRLMELREGVAKPNVLCDACHGYEPLHAKNPKAYPMESGSNKERCLRCHNPKNSPGFVYDTYLAAVRCDREEGRGL